MVRAFVDGWERDHGDGTVQRDRLGRRNPGARAVRDGLGHFSGARLLASGAEALSEKTRELGGTYVPLGTIHKVLRAEYPRTELRVADSLVAAIERPDAFHDGTLNIYPNPKATLAARSACCSGSDLDSLTGTASP